MEAISKGRFYLATITTNNESGYKLTKGRLYQVLSVDSSHTATIKDNSGECVRLYNRVFWMMFEDPLIDSNTQVSHDQEDIRGYNVGSSDYAKHKIQPWDIWLEYNLNPWDADIVKRVLRTKETDDRILDYEKIVHICKERIRQLKSDHK